MTPALPQALYDALAARPLGEAAEWAQVDAMWNPAWRWADAITNAEPALHDADLPPVVGPLGWQLMALGPDDPAPVQPLPSSWAAMLGPLPEALTLLQASCLRLWQAGGDRVWARWSDIGGSLQPPVAEALHQNWLPLARAIVADPTCPALGHYHPGTVGAVHTPLHRQNLDHLALVLGHGAHPDWPADPALDIFSPEDDDWRVRAGTGILHAIDNLPALELLLAANVTTTPLTPVGAPHWPDAAWGTWPTSTDTWVAMADRLADHRRAHGIDPQPGRRHMLAHALKIGRLDLADALGRAAWFVNPADPLVLPTPHLAFAEGPVEQGLLGALYPGPTHPGLGLPWPRPTLRQITDHARVNPWPTTVGWERLRQAWLVPALARPDLLRQASTHVFPKATPLTVPDGLWAWARWVHERVGVSPEGRFGLLASDTDPHDPAWQALGESWGATPADRWTAYLGLCVCSPGPGHWADPWLVARHSMGAVLGPLDLAALPTDLRDAWWALWRTDLQAILTDRFFPSAWDRRSWTVRGRYPGSLIDAALAHGALDDARGAEVLLGEHLLQIRLQATFADERRSDVLPAPSALAPSIVAWGRDGGTQDLLWKDLPETQVWLADVRQALLDHHLVTTLGTGRLRQRA